MNERTCECCHGTGVGPANSNFAGKPCAVCGGNAEFAQIVEIVRMMPEDLRPDPVDIEPLI